MSLGNIFSMLEGKVASYLLFNINFMDLLGCDFYVPAKMFMHNWWKKIKSISGIVNTLTFSFYIIFLFFVSKKLTNIRNYLGFFFLYPEIHDSRAQ